MAVNPFDNTRAGYSWDPNRGWVSPTKVTRGTWLGEGLGMAADYDPTKDTYRQGVNGTQETAMQRAYRWAKDLLASGKATNAQSALNFAMAQLSSDWQRGQHGQQPDWGGWDLGWDPTQFRYNEYGAQYDPNIDYAHATRWLDASGAMQSDPNRAQPGYTVGVGPTPPPAAPTLAPAPAPAPAPVPGAPPVEAPEPTNTLVPSGSNVSAAENEAIKKNPRLRMQMLMRSLGFGDPASQRNIIGSQVGKLAGQLFDPWVLTQGIGSPDQAPDYGQMFAKFANYLNTGGGMSGIRGDAANALQAIGSGTAGPFEDTDLMTMLEDFNNLRFTGSSDIFQRGQQNRVQDVLSAYTDMMGQGIQGGAGTFGAGQNLLKFLQANPMYSFMTGR